MSDNEWICAICLEKDLSGCYILKPCQHKFHTDCIINSLRRVGPNCPLCRGLPENQTSNYYNNIVMDIAGNIVFDYRNN